MAAQPRCGLRKSTACAALVRLRTQFIAAARAGHRLRRAGRHEHYRLPAVRARALAAGSVWCELRNLLSLEAPAMATSLVAALARLWLRGSNSSSIRFRH